MRHEDDLRSQHRRDPHVFREIIVETDQEASLDSEQIDHIVGIAGAQGWVDERVQLPKLGDEPAWSHGHIAIEKPAGVIGLEQAGHEHDAEFTSDRHKSPRGRPVGNRLGYADKPRAIKVLQERVAAQGAFVKAHDFCALVNSPPG